MKKRLLLGLILTLLPALAGAGLFENFVTDVGGKDLYFASKFRHLGGKEGQRVGLLSPGAAGTPPALWQCRRPLGKNFLQGRKGQRIAVKGGNMQGEEGAQAVDLSPISPQQRKIRLNPRQLQVTNAQGNAALDTRRIIMINSNPPGCFQDGADRREIFVSEVAADKGVISFHCFRLYKFSV